MKDIDIIFDNPWATYYVGSNVAGQVIINLDCPQKVKDISVKIKGEASVKWSEVETISNAEGKDETREVDYTSSEKYFENSYKLFKAQNGEEEMSIGSHTFDFSSLLPEVLPSSFEAQYGYVRYTVKVTVNRVWKFDKECKAAFTVISPLDLNNVQEAKVPISVHKEKYIGFWCCKSGPLSATLFVPGSGFVGGQTIPISLEVGNATDKNTKPGVCTLQKIITYKSTSPTQKTKVDRIVIAEVKLGIVTSGTTKKYSENLIVPALPPSNLQNCAIMNVRYELQVQVKVKAVFLRGLKFSRPIIFGTIPLVLTSNSAIHTPSPSIPVPDSTVFEDTRPSAPKHSSIDGLNDVEKKDSPSLPFGWNFGLNSNNLYPNLPRPTFEESQFNIKANIRDKDDNDRTEVTEDWTPRYPKYDFSQSKS